MPVGQVILGVRELEASAARIAALGLTVLDGGVHPGLGTANRVVPLGNAYLELLGVVDRDEAAANPFGRTLLARTAAGDRLVRWSIRTDDIDAAGARLGLTSERRRRLRPDGTELSWRAAGIELSWEEPCLPFFMQWDAPGDYPGAILVTHRAGPCRLAWLQLATPDRARLERWTAGTTDLPLRVSDGDAAIDALGITTGSGEIIVRSDDGGGR